MTFSFLMNTILLMLLICAVLPILNIGQENFKREQEPCPFFNNALIAKVPIKVHILRIAYFCTLGSQFLITVYATSWVSMSILEGIPDAAIFSKDRRMFDLGVSWGAFGLFLASLISVFFTSMLPVLKKNLSDAYLWGITHLISGAALLSTIAVNDLQSVFIVLPLCGFSFVTSAAMPYAILNQLHDKYTLICKASDCVHSAEDCPTNKRFKESPLSIQLIRFLRNTPSYEDKLHIPCSQKEVWESSMKSWSFFSQTMMYCVLPSMFIFWPEEDDNVWGLFAAGCSAFIGSLLCFLL